MWQRFLTGSAAIALAACQTLTPSEDSPPPPQARAEAPAVDSVPAPPPPKPRPTARKIPPPAVTPAAPVAPGTIVVVGLSRGELAKTLGEPAARVDRNPGQTWVYRQGGCAVEVLLLLDVMKNDMIAVDRKVSGTDGTPRGEQTCLQRIKGSHGS